MPLVASATRNADDAASASDTRNHTTGSGNDAARPGDRDTAHDDSTPLPPRHDGQRPWRHIVIALIAIFGTAASIALFAVIGNREARVAELRLSGLASDHLQTINAGLKDATDLLYSLRAYFESLGHAPTRAEFQSFSGSLRERVPGLRDTGWAPRVTAAEREAFERDIRTSGIADFQIKERDASGALVPARPRPEYFPILYSDPGAINRGILGFDLASEPLRGGTIARARATDHPAATPPVKLVNIQRRNGGMMTFIPVNARGEHPGEAARPIGGIVLGAFETALMIENILATRLNLAGLDVYVFDPNGLAGSRALYWHAADGRPAPAEASLRVGRYWEGTLTIVDQRIGVIFVPSEAFDAGASGWTASIVLCAGLTVTALIAVYLWFSGKRTRELETLTVSLHDAMDELQRNGSKLDHMARHDALTGLPNRIRFREELAAGLRRARRGQGMAVLYLDLDRFKMVNDTLGHPVGDLLLCDVARRLRETVREVDTITRLGGDEFAIAQNGDEQPLAAEMLARRVIDTLSRPYDLNGNRVVVGASVGITIAGRDDADVDQLLRRADMALYAAKRNGRGTWRCFQPEMDNEVQERRGLEMDLRHALETGGLELLYQPQVSLADGAVRGFEALLRWRHPERGLVLPSDFIQCAEETGLIVPIGIRVVRMALAEAASWPDGIRVAVNLSPYQLARDDLADTIETALTDSGLIGSRLELEVTETALLRHHMQGLATLKRLRGMGVRVAMDDFGTGYASLSHLRSFPFDRLKIDQSFVAGMTESAQAAAVVRTILQMAASMEIATTAEGVETEAQLQLLAASGCDEAQGFLFSAPQPPAEVPRLLRQWPMVAAVTEQTGPT